MKNDTINQFSIKAASKDPIPGGGGVAACVGGLASALSEMVTNLTIGKKTYSQYEDELVAIRQQAETLRNELLDCINKDAEAFLPLAKAYSADKNESGYGEHLEQCLVDAAASPMAILKYCCQIIDLDERLAVIGSKLSVSDAASSVMLAHGALYAAYINVQVNTRLMKNKGRAEALDCEARSLVSQYGKKAETIFNDIFARLQQ